MITHRPLASALLAFTVVLAVAATWGPAARPAFAAAPPSSNGAIPDFTQGDAIPDGATHDWNLGPTGARGWMYSRQLETTEARQIRITSVDEGSPADGILQPGDVILGVGGEHFSFDPRVEFGRAIGVAEAAGGRLRLIRWRNGRTQTVRLTLPVLGAYAPTAPFDCAKSSRILDRAWAALARRMEAAPDDGNPIERSLNAMALLSSGRAEYRPLIRQQVAWAAGYSDLERRQLHSWWYGPVTMLVAEYTIATGDRAFMPALTRLTSEIVAGQSEVGSWGHRFVQANGRLAGYGMMNAPGLPLTVSLILAREAGVEVPGLDEAIDRAAGLIRFYVGKGSVPYGDHRPWIEAHEDNGKNGAAAVMFNLLGEAEAAEYFSRMSVASHGAERDTGHTGNFFNMLWAMPGVALSGPNASGAWMEEFGWAYDLARQWDGTFRHQGPPADRPDSYGGWDATGAFVLAYAQSRRGTHLTGRTPSVVTQVTADVADGLIDDGRGWGPRRGLAAYADRSEADLMAGLRRWSPVVRDRSATELARREGDPVPALVSMLAEEDLHARLGACVALARLEGRAAAAVPALRELLQADEMWLRIRAAEALSRIGNQAIAALPDLLRMLATPDPVADPRGMEPRYLCFALFDRREGMLGRSLDGVDRDLLRAAVVAGLQNQDGRARGTIDSVYRNLSYEEIEPLLPAILEAVREPAPSGIMFADGIRVSGLDVLARHRIAEGLPLCLTVVDPDRWGLDGRIRQCLAALRQYGGAARSELPRLRALEDELRAKGWKDDRIKPLGIPAIIEAIESDEDPPTLRPIRTIVAGQ